MLAIDMSDDEQRIKPVTFDFIIQGMQEVLCQALRAAGDFHLWHPVQKCGRRVGGLLGKRSARSEQFFLLQRQSGCV